MKKIIFLLIIIIIPLNVHAVNINSSNLIAMDLDSGRIFYEKNKDEKKLIASTSKIMTSILAIESDKLQDITEATEEILTMYGSNIYLEYHEHMTLEDLIYGLLLRSGNDASATIAKHVAKTEENFVKAKINTVIFLTDTIFKNPSGLDDDETSMNYSTAYDMALLYKYAYQNETFRKIISTKTYQTSSDYKAYSWTNRADIIHEYDKCTGAKTGYTPKAGRVLMSSASNNDLNVVIFSINKSNYDTKLHQNIYEDIFDNYKNVELVNKNNFKVDNNIYNKKLYITSSIIYPLTKQEEQKITKKIEYVEKIKNPHDKDVVGHLYIMLNDEIISKRDILIEVEKLSIKEKIINFFKKIF